MPKIKSKNTRISLHHQLPKPFPAKKTISDDVSCENERKKRKLHCFLVHQRKHEKKNRRFVRELGGSSASPTQKSLNTATLPSPHHVPLHKKVDDLGKYPMGQTTYHEPEMAGTSNVQDIPNVSNSNRPLQDYLMQQMLLEQQNKRRLMMARQEQDSSSNMPPSQEPPAVGGRPPEQQNQTTQHPRVPTRTKNQPTPSAGAGTPASTSMEANAQAPKNDKVQAMMSHIAQILHNQGPYGGWRAEVSVKTRATNVYQMITSLRLIQPRIDLTQAAQAAMSFELTAFTKANERVDYNTECAEKLKDIRNTRKRQAGVTYQSGIMPQTGAGQNQIPGNFPATHQSEMQGSASGQQQINDVPLLDQLNSLSAQESDQVSRLANEMLNKTSSEDMETIKMNLSNMTPEQRQYLSQKNLDPMTYFFRSQALNQIRRHRRARLEMGRAPNTGVDASGNMMGDPMMNSQQQRQMLQDKADGLRSQEAGQLVVPASSSQMNQAAFPNNNNTNRRWAKSDPRQFPATHQSEMQGSPSGQQQRQKLKVMLQLQRAQQRSGKGISMPGDLQPNTFGPRPKRRLV